VPVTSTGTEPYAAAVESAPLNRLIELEKQVADLTSRLDAAKRVRGRDLHEVEVLTDRLAASAYSALDQAEGAELAQILEPLAFAAGKQLPYPNAMGLPRPERDERLGRSVY